MKAHLNAPADPVAALKFHILQLQEHAAKLAREGRNEEARKVRDRLIALLNRLDLMRTEGIHGSDGQVGAFAPRVAARCGRVVE